MPTLLAFPSDGWRTTLDALCSYARAVGGIRGALMHHADLISDPDRIDHLMRVLRAAHTAGSAQMGE